MKISNADPQGGSSSTGTGMRRSIRITVVVLCLASLLAIGVALIRHRSPAVVLDKASSGSEDVAVLSSTTPAKEGLNREVSASQTASRPQNVYAQPEPTSAMRNLVNSLVNLEPGSGGLTEEQAAAWRQNLRALVQQGAGAVPAISEFLSQNVDLNFSAADRRALGYGSVRSALFQALSEIGGPAAINVMSQVLQTAADPREIALLGQQLEQLDPGVHRAEIYDAAREALGMAAEGKLPNRDVAPLFEVLQQFGGANSVAELERNAQQWSYYAAISLARLPDGAGIPSLAQIAGNPGSVSPGEQIAALDMLAQAVAQSDQARAALLDLARQNKLSPDQWNAVTPILAGNQMFFQNSAFDNGLNSVSPNDVKSVNIPGSNQALLTAPWGALTLDQIDHQKAFLDELLAVTSSPAGLESLQRARNILANRVFQIAGTTGK